MDSLGGYQPTVTSVPCTGPRSEATRPGAGFNAARAGQRSFRTTVHFTERGYHPTALVSGPVAMVWLPYDFYQDGKWSHCGVDVFTLLKTDGSWRIATLAWSVDQPPACAPHPDGPPPGAAAR